MFAGLKRKLEQLENQKTSSTSAVTTSQQSSSNEPPSQVKDQPFAQYLSKQQWGKLHPHQQEAVKFLMNRLTARTSTGAILADDMGTGKTCTAIFTSWILARSMQCKGLVLCPTGLINNWYSELQRWFPESLGRTAIVLSAINQSKSAKSLDLQVNRFVTSHAVEHPLLVLSYDQFRIYAQALNTIPSLEFVFCDEGHRIKGLDSKISLALNGCSAMRRVVMTGTPVQNNLQELFALVNFVAPGVLGDDVVAFRERYEGVGSGSAGEEQRKQAQQELQAKVQSLMLRRTKEQVLAKILPARHIRYLFVNFDYDASAIPPSLAEEHPTDVGGGSTNQQTDVYRQCCDSAREKMAAQQQSSTPPALLPVFMKARMICSYGAGAAISSDGVVAAATGPMPALSSSSGSSSVSASTSTSISIQDRATLLLTQSAKLRALRNLLLHLRRSRPQEKVIVASAFLDTLDAVKVMVSSEKFSSLRIDGSVSTDARHKILKLFNSATMTSNHEPLFSILLLAMKAGGEGLNLVAANHLVMMDVDWNPAVDAQTMGRIWRPGQTKEIYIYRMIIPNTIEESILRRQLQKTSLQFVLQGQKSIFSDDESSSSSSSSRLPSEEEDPAVTDAADAGDAGDRGIDEPTGSSERDDEQVLLSIESQSMTTLLHPRDNDDAIDVVLASKLIQDGDHAVGEHRSGYDVLLTQLCRHPREGSAPSVVYPTSLRITTSLESVVM